MPKDILKTFVKPKIEKEVVKQEEVKFENLPVQDYAKAKALIKHLDIGQFTTVSINDIEQFIYFVSLLIESESSMLIIKPDQFISNSFKVMKTEK